MKKILFVAGAFFVFLSAHAQFTVVTDTPTGTPINDDDIIAFGHVGIPAKLPFFINNTSSSETIYMRVEFTSAANADGSQMQLCITPTCYTSIAVGQSYPQEQGATSLPLDPGEQSNNGNYFMNLENGNGAQVIDYVFTFYQVNGTGFPIGTPLTFTYRYDPNMAVKGMEKMEVSVYPTTVTDVMMVNSDEALKMEVYNLLGSLVKSMELPRGENQINMSDLASQVYLVRFENEMGAVQTKKIIVK
jgi:hypothetical protein